MFVVAAPFSAAVVSAAGCGLFINFDTGRYVLADAGTCTGSADCDGGACCLISDTPTFACRPSPCMAIAPLPAVAVQLCEGQSDCTGGPCIPQNCPTWVSLQIQACGLIPMCSEVGLVDASGSSPSLPSDASSAIIVDAPSTTAPPFDAGP
ncbi:MAG: hypothetical protein ABSC94_09170 [Polyangiaceae bacterium]